MKLKQWVKLIPLSVVASSLCLCAYASSDLEAIMKARNLSEKDILAAAKTYQPSGRRDEYMVFSSGGQSGQVIVYGVPSMRIYKYIAVFTPEPWQGYGYDQESKKVLAGGKIRGRDITWGDSHHPAFTERNGEYTGDYLFINDKANPRLAVIDLKSFETVQIVTNPIIKSEHGGAFVTPNSEYVIEASQYAAPLDDNYAPIEAYESRYRGAVTMWKFDMKKGRINEKESVTLELPPYMQDLSDAGKGVSDGWAFINSFNTEMYTGGIEVGMPPNEAGMSRNDHDYLHVFNWKKIAELAKDEKNVRIINGHRVVPMEVAVKNNALFLVPEPKSPHGVDVSPDGRYIVVGGKLDTHASVYDFEKIKKQIEKKEFAGKDPFGIPILDIDKSLHGQVELGLGPLHSAFDSKDGIIYTSLYVDSQVVRWDYKNLKVLDRTNVHYNIGHLDSMEGKSSKPKGQWLLALDKLSIDRFNPVGPLHPQNHQLIDIPPPLPFSVHELFRYASCTSGLDVHEAEHYCDCFGLSVKEHYGKAFSKLSGGMKQKVLAALAFARHASVMLFDEPTANLDTEGRRVFGEIIRDSRFSETTMVFISHRLEELNAVLNRAVWLDLGKVVKDEKL